MSTQKKGTTPESKTVTTEVVDTQTTEVVDAESTESEGSIEEALQEKIKEYEKTVEDLKAKIATQAIDIEALKTIKDMQDQALSSIMSDPETKEENLRFKLAKEGLTLVVIDGKNYSTGNATLQGVPVNDLSDEVKQKLLEGGTFFTEL